MTTEVTPATVTMRVFADSLMPGKGRTDNLFKFLGALDEARIAAFLSGLFAVVGRVVDGEQGAAELEAFLIEQETAARTLAAIRRAGPTGIPPEPLAAPSWVPLRRPLREARIALFTSGAIRRPVDQPYIAPGYTHEQALADPAKAYDRIPALRALPADVDVREILVEHIAYDVRAARRDFNVIFPIERLRELAGAGTIGELADRHYSFSGLTNLQRLIDEAAPAWAEQVAADGIDAVLLTPG